MVSRTMKYNPAFLTDRELIESFVVHHKDFELVMQTIEENVGASNQHLLVTGPRGIGKTMLLLRVAAEVRQSETLSKIWYPLKFAEESYEISTPGEFWLNAIRHLAEQTEDKSWKKVWEELNAVIDEDQLRERALAKLMDFADTQKKRLLIIVENLNMLLGDQMDRDDAWKIRHTLQNEPRIMFLSSAVKGFDDVEGIDKALFDAFIRHELQPLDEKQCEKVWISTTGKQITGNKARPIQILTGGSPRLVKIISIFGADLSLKELMGDLTHLVDDHTDYFKSQIEVLPPKERKVFVSLAELWDPSPTKNIASLARLPVNKTSALLNRLVGRGIVSLVKTDGRAKLYQLSERMFNIYYLMRSRSNRSSRVKIVVRFMVVYYGTEKITDKVKRIAEEACCLESEQRGDHCLLVEEIIKDPTMAPIREKIIESVPRDFLNSPQFSAGVRRSVYFHDYVRSLRVTGGYLNEEEKVINEKGLIRKSKKELRDAVEKFPSDYAAWINWGNFLFYVEEDLDGAEKAFKKALSLEPKSFVPWLGLGTFLEGSAARYEEAENAYRRAVEMEPMLFWVWAQLGTLLYRRLNRYEEARSAYEKAIKISPEYIYALGNLGDLLQDKFDDYEDAGDIYLKITKIKPDDVRPWIKLGELYQDKLGRYEEAENAYRQILRIEPDNIGGWRRLGKILEDQFSRYEEAEDAYRKITKIQPDSFVGWLSLGTLFYFKLDRFEEAEHAYRKAIETDPNDMTLIMLGDLLNKKMGRYDEAEKNYFSAIELAPDNELVYPSLFSLLLKKKERHEEALDLAQKALKNVPDCSRLLGWFSDLICENNAFDLLPLAETWIEKAMASSPQDAEHLHTYSKILLALGKTDQALEAGRQYLQNKSATDEDRLDETLDLFIGFAAHGLGAEILEMIETSQHREALEPLTAGLRMYQGQDIEIAVEIKEIAKDIVQSIEVEKKRIEQKL